MKTAGTVGGYLIDRLYSLGVRHVFGVPGDYVLGFYNMLSKSQLELINTCDEQGAGFAADAYARLKGIGAVCVTYGVGGLKVVNTTAQAYAEKSPVVVISGAPGIREREKNPLLHHRVRDFDTQKNIFEEVTVASTALDDAQTAVQEIERVLAALFRFKRPVYIELPRDMILSEIGEHRHKAAYREKRSNPVVLRELVAEAVGMINSADKPVIIAGEEIHRFGLQNQLLDFVNKTNIPVASTILSKSVINELHSSYIGVYQGAAGHEFVQKYVESSDCIIILGALLTDVSLGMFSAKIDQAKTIYVTSERFSVGYHLYENVLLQDFIRALTRSKIKPRQYLTDKPNPRYSYGPGFVKGNKITIRHLFERLNSFLTDDMIVIADVGDALFGSIDLIIRGKTQFLSTAYYASLGFAVPASIGAKLAMPHLRPVVLVGDGAFQMTGMELSTIVRYRLDPIILVLNNSGYMTERIMLDGPFNDLQPWQHSKLGQIVGGGHGYDVRTEDQLESTLAAAKKSREACIIDVHLDPKDMSETLRRLTKGFAERV